ncbi:hypothetical protein MTR62_20190 [Novosphingobium sp. 1949]|uniref:MmyB-like transcription regulator ligand binding domain-containing protein n=1 Tax=Novosphingobium organovorum TaxID=2930092 RepID=A0ABT0BIW1_9SPHN|nr:hypothetical protein [Novosphingobium organovorum]MCJ2184986.1 hypothetical protein [Novosphingobium organovorum]
MTWCAWIEQGREIGVSSEALGRLARALALTPAERAYLFELAERRDPDAPAVLEAEQAPASVAALVDAVPHPAYALDRLWNACCWNAGAQALFVGWLGEGGAAEPNLLRYTFTSPAAQRLLPDWEERARRLLAEFRAHCAPMVNDAALEAFIDQMRIESPLFAAEWERQSVLAREGGERGFHHGEAGLRRYVQHTFSPAERPDYKVVILFPAPPA